MRRTVGVEEEFHLVDLKTRRLTPRAPELLRELPDAYVAELQRCVVELNSEVVDTLDELRQTLQRQRKVLIDAAATLGIGVVAAGAVPLSVPAEMQITATPRYRQMLSDYQLLAREQLICGTQIHVGVEDRDESVVVAHRVAPYLPTLLALSASSPFWADGSDTGYSSARTLVWQRWPTSGPANMLTSANEYDKLVADLVATGVITDEGMAYFDVRPALSVPTLELRVCDSCPSVDTIVLIAGLFRAMVQREIEGLRADRAPCEISPVLVRAATWRAARSGLEGDLVDIAGPSSRPAGEVVCQLLRRLRPQLEDTGDWPVVRDLAQQVLLAGTSWRASAGRCAGGAADRRRRSAHRRDLGRMARSWAAAILDSPTLLFGYHQTDKHLTGAPSYDEAINEYGAREQDTTPFSPPSPHSASPRCGREKRHRTGPAGRKHRVPRQRTEPRPGLPARSCPSTRRRRRLDGAHARSRTAGTGAQRLPARHLRRTGHPRRRHHRPAHPRPSARLPFLRAAVPIAGPGARQRH